MNDGHLHVFLRDVVDSDVAMVFEIMFLLENESRECIFILYVLKVCGDEFSGR